MLSASLLHLTEVRAVSHARTSNQLPQPWTLVTDALVFPQNINLFSKIDVNGDGAHPLYKKLKTAAGKKTLMSMIGGKNTPSLHPFTSLSLYCHVASRAKKHASTGCQWDGTRDACTMNVTASMDPPWMYHD